MASPPFFPSISSWIVLALPSHCCLKLSCPIKSINLASRLGLPLLHQTHLKYLPNKMPCSSLVHQFTYFESRIILLWEKILNGSLYWMKFRLFGHLPKLHLPHTFTYSLHSNHTFHWWFPNTLSSLFSLLRIFSWLFLFIWGTPTYLLRWSFKFKFSSYYFLCLLLPPHEQRSLLFISIPIALCMLWPPSMQSFILFRPNSMLAISRCSM